MSPRVYDLHIQICGTCQLLRHPKMTDLNPTYIVPVSGIDFTRYIAFYSLLAGTPLRPGLVLAASGGCMVSYMALMSDWSKNVEKWRINSQMFAFKPVILMPRMLSLLMTGSLYKRPNIDKFIISSFPESKLMNIEIITGFYSRKASKVCISSNLMPSESALSATNFLLGDVDVEHNEGKMLPILRSIEATTNIPFLLPPIGESKLIDYGIHSPSPLTFLRGNSQLLKKVVYFAPIDVEKTGHTDTKTLVFINTIHTEISRLSSGFSGYTSYRDFSFLGKLFASERYLLVIYTPYETTLSLVDFRWEQVATTVDLIKKDVRFRLYL